MKCRIIFLDGQIFKGKRSKMYEWRMYLCILLKIHKCIQYYIFFHTKLFCIDWHFFFELLLYPRNNAVKEKHEIPIFELRFKIQTHFYYSLIGKRFIPVSFFILRFFIPRYIVIFSSDDSIFDLVLATTTLNIYNRESANFRTLHSED